VRQVPVEKAEREELIRATGSDVIPVLVLETGELVVGEDEILRRLAAAPGTDPAQAEAHRLKAEKARRRQLEEECECLQPATR
jgi:hypothetical protein